MKHYMSEAREAYMDMYHGLFSKKLAEWAISNMEVLDSSTKAMKPLRPHSIEEVQAAFKDSELDLQEEFLYTAWYLFNMAYADYPKSLTTDKQRALFVWETISDVDCCPEAVLECFIAKMCVMEVPIYWEKYL